MNAEPVKIVVVPNAGGDNGSDQNGLTVGRWKENLCDCFNHCVPNCLMATCCHCFTMGQITARIGLYPYMRIVVLYWVCAIVYIVCNIIKSIVQTREQATANTIVSEYLSGTITLSDAFAQARASDDRVLTATIITAIISSVFGIVALLVHFQIRRRVRQIFKIPGSCCCDFCIPCWCSCCSMAQLATHTTAYQPDVCNFGPRDTLPGYCQQA